MHLKSENVNSGLYVAKKKFNTLMYEKPNKKNKKITKSKEIKKKFSGFFKVTKLKSII